MPAYKIKRIKEVSILAETKRVAEKGGVGIRYDVPKNVSGNKTIRQKDIDIDNYIG